VPGVGDNTSLTLGPARNYDELPVLDLSGDGPLPFDLNALAAVAPLAAPRPAVSADDDLTGESFAEFARQLATESLPSRHGSSASGTPRGASSDTLHAAARTATGVPQEPDLVSADGSLRLSGDVLMCACPDCRAPLSVRIWLMTAECWRCATTIELTEEQEREARKLMRKREQLRQKAAAATPAAAPVAKQPTPPPQPEPAPPPRPASAPPPKAPPQAKKSPPRRRAQPRGYAAARNRIRRRSGEAALLAFLRTLFRDMPAWLISLLIHMAALTLLALLTIEETPEEPFVLLSVDTSVNRRTGENADAVVIDKREFELPLPTKEIPESQAAKDALIAADQDARELRLDPNAPLPLLADIEEVKQKLKSSSAGQSMLLARDPRLRVEMVQQEGGTTLTEAAVSRGLRYIAEQQNEDGGWGLSGRRSEAAGTSLALLPFLGAGQTHQIGIYKDEISAGLRWLLEHQGEDGDLRHGTGGNHGMYAHGQAAIVLCEAYKMTGDEQFRAAAQKSIDFIVAAQHPRGGWRYKPGEEGDLSVTGWQLMALQSAKAAHLDVPPQAMDRAAAYLDEVSSNGGARYGYQRGRSPSESMTAEGLLSRMYLGWNLRLNPELGDGIKWLEQNHPPDARKPNMYYWYYATQAMHHHGGPEWERWNLKLRDILVNSQETRGDMAGSWTPQESHDRTGGRLYMTSLAVCTLEIYYRHAPLFRQIKLD
jgi:hypothetical protein